MVDLSSILSQGSSIDRLVAQYMSLERRPVNTLESKKSSLNTKIAIFNDAKNKLLSLYSGAEKLADTSNDSVFDSVRVSSSDTTALSVTADTDAAQGQYVFRIRQLATATSMRSTATLNTNPSTMSASQVVSGSAQLDTDEAWADAGFDTTPDGTVTINGETFTLSDYATVDDFFEAVNTDGSADANIFYDSVRDKIIIESTDGGNLTLSETGTNGFLTEVNIGSGTYTTNESGLNAGTYLDEMNFDSGLSSSDTGSFTINGATIEWDADADTLNGVISRINHSDAGVTAFYDDTLDRVVITSNTMGSEEIEWEDVEGSFLTNTLKFSGVTQNVGQDAKFTINSTSASDEITKTSNTFTLNGLIINLNQTTVENDSYSDSETTSVTVTSEKDESALRNRVSAFLDGYNSLIDYIKSKTAVDMTTYSRGALAGESIFSSLRSSVMSVMMGQASDLEEGKPSYLADIGITFDASLHASITDASAFSDWLEDDPDAVADLFNSTNGLATQIVGILEPFTESYGIIDDRKQAYQDQITDIDDRIKRLEERLERKESYYRTQFTNLQAALNALTFQQSIISNLTNMLNSRYQ